MPDSADKVSAARGSRDRPAPKEASNVMATIVAQGQENVARLEESFNGPVTELATDYLRPNAANPRRRISVASVEEMMNGIRQVGGEILQPLLVRPTPLEADGSRYEVVCGNRRLMAARRLGMPKVPVRVREMDDEQAMRFALWENLAREDLDAMDLAESINGLRMIERLSWDEISDRFGFSRQWAWKQQKLAELPEVVKDMVREGKLSPSKAMLLSQITTGAEDVITTASGAVKRGLSHRALQDEVATLRKHVLTSSDVPATSEGSRKHVLTWVAPVGIPRRGHTRLIKATEELVDTLNAGELDPEYARSMRHIAQRILEIADTDEEKKEPPDETRRNKAKTLPAT